jgi:hypothetical protein
VTRHDPVLGAGSRHPNYFLRAKIRREKGRDRLPMPELIDRKERRSVLVRMCRFSI